MVRYNQPQVAMFRNLLIILLLSLLHLSTCELDTHEREDNCDHQVDVDNENGTTHYISKVSNSVKFYLLTPDNETIPLNSTNLDLVNTTQPTKFIIHGLGTYEDHVWIDKMSAVYHTNGDYNIIAVDWSAISVQNTDYVVTAVDAVGNVVGTFIMELTKTNVQYLYDVHLIGSSIGAQVGGAAGETISANGTKVGRITGLNPKQPRDLEILDEDDAQFVDVIHTTTVLGKGKTGRVDFYVVGDEGTPVCYNTTGNGTEEYGGYENLEKCGELLANDYYIKSIENITRYQGVSCHQGPDEVKRLCDKAKSAVMGEYVSRNASGFYLVSKDSASGLYNPGIFVLAFLVPLVLNRFV